MNSHESKSQRLSKSGRRQNEWRVFSGLTVLIVAMIGLATLAARDAPSAGSDNPQALAVPTITADEGCTRFARYWIDQSGVRVDPATIEGLTNCRLSDGGEWFVPTGAEDERLTEQARLTEDEEARTTPIKMDILSEIVALEATLSSSIIRDLERIYRARPHAVTGRINDTVTISRARSRYTRVVQAFLLDPDRRLLADYVGWLMQRKIGAYEALSNECLGNPETAYLRVVCLGLEDSLSVNYPPWLWDMRSTVWLNEYLAHLARTGRLPTISESQEVDSAFRSAAPMSNPRLQRTWHRAGHDSGGNQT